MPGAKQTRALPAHRDSRKCLLFSVSAALPPFSLLHLALFLIFPLLSVDAAGMTFCLPCQPGRARLLPGGTSNCEACPVSKFTTDTKSLECEKCPVGFSTHGREKSTSCSACAPGSKWYFGVCIICPAGQYRSAEDEASRGCQYCPVGMYSDRTSATLCLVCPPGLYQGTAGQTLCASCMRYVEVS